MKILCDTLDTNWMKTPDHNNSLVLCKKKLSGIETEASWTGKNIPYLLNDHILPVPTRGNNTWRKSSFQAEGLKAENKSALASKVLHYIFRILSTNMHLQCPFKPPSTASKRNITFIPKDGGSTRNEFHLVIYWKASSSLLGSWSSLLSRS